MADDVKESSVFTVNQDGHIAVWLTNSTTGKAGELPTNQVPTNDDGEVVMAVGGDLEVKVATAAADEDFDNNASRILDRATQEVHIIPTPTATGGLMPTEVTLGTVGGPGDYLKSIQVNVNSNTNAAVYVSQEGPAVVPLAKGTAGTAQPGGTATISVTASLAVTATANQFVGRIVRVVYIPNGGLAPISFKRRITAHAAFVATTALTFTVTHNLPQGAAITDWQLEPATSYELFPYNTPVGFYERRPGAESGFGAWRINADSGVDVHVVGKFTNN